MLRRSIVLSMTLSTILASVASMTTAATDHAAPSGTGAALLEALSRVPGHGGGTRVAGLLPRPGDPCGHPAGCSPAGLHRPRHWPSSRPTTRPPRSGWPPSWAPAAGTWASSAVCRRPTAGPRRSASTCSTWTAISASARRPRMAPSCSGPSIRRPSRTPSRRAATRLPRSGDRHAPLRCRRLRRGDGRGPRHGRPQPALRRRDRPQRAAGRLGQDAILNSADLATLEAMMAAADGEADSLADDPRLPRARPRWRPCGAAHPGHLPAGRHARPRPGHLPAPGRLTGGGHRAADHRAGRDLRADARGGCRGHPRRCDGHRAGRDHRARLSPTKPTRRSRPRSCRDASRDAPGGLVRGAPGRAARRPRRDLGDRVGPAGRGGDIGRGPHRGACSAGRCRRRPGDGRTRRRPATSTASSSTW